MDNQKVDRLLQSLGHLAEQLSNLSPKEKELFMSKAKARALEEGWEKSPLINAVERIKPLG